MKNERMSQSIEKMIKLSNSNEDLFQENIINDDNNQMNHRTILNNCIIEIIDIRINDIIKIDLSKESMMVINKKISDKSFDLLIESDYFLLDDMNLRTTDSIIIESSRIIDDEIRKYLNKRIS